MASKAAEGPSKQDLEHELDKLRQEITDFKTAAGLEAEDQIELVKRKYEDEIASLNRILKEGIADALRQGESEKRSLKREKQMLEVQVHDLRAALSEAQQDGILSSVFKSFKGPGSPSSMFLDLRAALSEAQQDGILSSVFKSFKGPGSPSSMFLDLRAALSEAQQDGILSSVFKSFKGPGSPSSMFLDLRAALSEAQQDGILSSVFKSFKGPGSPSSMFLDLRAALSEAQQDGILSSVFKSFKGPGSPSSMFLDLRAALSEAQQDGILSSVFKSFKGPGSPSSMFLDLHAALSEAQQDGILSSVFKSFKGPGSPSSMFLDLRAALSEAQQDGILSSVFKSFKGPGSPSSMFLDLRAALSEAQQDGILSSVFKSFKGPGSPSSMFLDLRATLSEAQQDGILSSVFKSFKDPGSPISHSLSDMEAAGFHLDRENGDQQVRSYAQRIPTQKEITQMQRRLVQTESRLKQAEEVLARRLREESDDTEDGIGLVDSTNAGEMEKLKRSSKGDLQIHVSVLTTQKQVLQEDLEHLRERLAEAHQVFQKAYSEAGECRKILVSSNANATSQPDGQTTPDTPPDSDSSSPTSTGHLFARLGNLEKLLSDSVQMFDIDDAPHSGLPTPSTSRDQSGLFLDQPTMAPHLAADPDSRRSSSFVEATDSKETSGPAYGHLRRKSASLGEVNALAVVKDSSNGKHLSSSTQLLTAAKSLTPEPEDRAKFDTTGDGCEMCANYEDRLQNSHKAQMILDKKLLEARAECERYRQDYDREQSFRVDVENRMSKLIEDLTQRAETVDADARQMRAKFRKLTEAREQERKDLETQLTSLKTQREETTNHLNKLESLYDQLLGSYRKQSDELRNEVISLPSSPQELEGLCLKLREELIETRAAREHLEDSLRSEVALLRSQLESEQHAKTQLDDLYSQEVAQLRNEVAQAKDSAKHFKESADKTDRRLEEISSTGKARADRISELEADLEKIPTLQAELLDTKKRISKMQEELNNSETVQMDFVKLSQSLQVELEKIRQAEHQVRWQHEDDVMLCGGPCKQPFVRGKRKQHCWHCGQIYCTTCLTQTVSSGPQGRPTPVCDVCHTILVQHSAPYFATAPPEGN